MTSKIQIFGPNLTFRRGHFGQFSGSKKSFSGLLLDFLRAIWEVLVLSGPIEVLFSARKGKK